MRFNRNGLVTIKMACGGFRLVLQCAIHSANAIINTFNGSTCYSSRGSCAVYLAELLLLNAIVAVVTCDGVSVDDVFSSCTKDMYGIENRKSAHPIGWLKRLRTCEISVNMR